MDTAIAYNLLDLTTAVQDDLKDPSFSSTRIARYLNYGQLAIFNTHNFKFCETSISGALTIGEYTYDQQSNHQSTIGGIVYDPANTNRRFELDESNYLEHREFFERYPDPDLEPDSLPSHWTEYGTQVYFNCPVDIAYTFVQRYFRTPTSMTVDASVPDVPESFRELLELYALYRSEKYRQNHDVAATYLQEFENGLESMNLRYSGNQLAPTQMRQSRYNVDV